MSESNQVKWRGVRPTSPESDPIPVKEMAGGTGFTLIQKGRIFNSARGVNTDFFSAALNPTNSPTTFRIYIATDVAGILSVRRTNTATAVTVTENLNAGANLNADAAYMFDILVTSSETINLRYNIATTIIYCLIVELRGGLA